MRQNLSSFPIVTLAALAAVLALSGCSSFEMPSFPSLPDLPKLPSFDGRSDAVPPPVPPMSPEIASKYTSEDFVGRWGNTSYQREADRPRTLAAARGHCRQPYVIAKGPNGGLVMRLPGQRQPTELRTKGSSDGKNYIGPPGEPGGGPQDQEIVSFDGRVLITRYVDSSAANRFGSQVYVRCTRQA